MKKCVACLQNHEDYWFRSRVTRHGNLSVESKCTQCTAKHNNSQHRNKRYDMPKSFEKMVEDQKGLCALCGKLPQIKGLSVDHCHKTDKVRGLLCTKCNLGLGAFGDSIELLQAAIDYLKCNQSTG